MISVYKPDEIPPSLSSRRTDEELQGYTYGDALYQLGDKEMARWLLLHSCGVKMARVEGREIPRFPWEPEPPEPTPEEQATAAERAEREALARQRQLDEYMRGLGIRLKDAQAGLNTRRTDGRATVGA